VRVAFAGSPPAAVPVLRALAGSRHEVAIVVSQPDRPRGRAGTPTPTPVAGEAARLGIEAIRPDTINAPEVLARLEELDLGAICVAAYGRILKDPILDGWTCLNVHYSLLPAYRGAAPVERALMDGVGITGVTIMRMDAGLDTGPVALRHELEVAPGEDAGSLTQRLAQLGGPMLVEALDRLEAGELELVPQPEEGVSLAPKITDEDRVLDFARPAGALADQVRALSPTIGAWCLIDGQRFKVWRAEARPGSYPSGLSVDGGHLLAGTGDGALDLLELQPPNRARMAAGAFLRGWRGALELGRADG
jgi:methionyl-tRNA formyltransferase